MKINVTSDYILNVFYALMSAWLLFLMMIGIIGKMEYFLAVWNVIGKLLFFVHTASFYYFLMSQAEMGFLMYNKSAWNFTVLTFQA